MTGFAAGLAQGLSGIPGVLEQRRAGAQAAQFQQQRLDLARQQFGFERDKFGKRQSLEQDKLKAAARKQAIDLGTASFTDLKTRLSSVAKDSDAEQARGMLDALVKSGVTGTIAMNLAGGDQALAAAKKSEIESVFGAIVSTALTRQQRLEQKAGEITNEAAANASPEVLSSKAAVAAASQPPTKIEQLTQALEKARASKNDVLVKNLEAMIAKETTPTSGTTVNVGNAENQFNKDRAKFIAKAQEDIIGAGLTATTTKANAMRLGELLSDPGLQTGKLQPAFSSLQAIGDSIGFDVDKFAQETFGKPIGDLTTKQEFSRVARQMAFAELNKFKGATSEGELNFAQSLTAQLGGDLDANIRAVAAMEALAEIGQENGSEMSLAETQSEVNALRRKMLSRNADEIRIRTAEIAARIRKQRAEATPAAPVSDFSAMSDEEFLTQNLTQFANNPAALRAFNEEMRKRGLAGE